MQDTAIEDGQNGAHILQSYYKYDSSQSVSVGGMTVRPVTSITVYTDNSGAAPSGAADERTTSYQYAYGSGAHVSKITTTLPPVLSSQHESGNATTVQNFDSYGYPTSSTDADGNTSTTTYDAKTGQLTKIVDADNDTTSETLDSLGRPLTLVDADGPHHQHQLYRQRNDQHRAHDAAGRAGPGRAV